MLVVSCHTDTGFSEHSLEVQDNGNVFFGHLDNFAGVYAVMQAYFSGRMNKETLRIELTYDEEGDFEGAYEMLDTLRKHDVVIVVDVTGTVTRKDFLVEQCESYVLRQFLDKILFGLEYNIQSGCLDPVADEDETQVYKKRCTNVCALCIPVTGGDYNDGPVKCRKEAILSVTEALCRIAENFHVFCHDNDIPSV